MTDTEKLRKAAYLLGLATGGIYAMRESCTLDSADSLLNTLQKGIYDLFYSEPNKKEQFSLLHSVFGRMGLTMNDFTKEELEELLYLFECVKTSPAWIYREGYHDNLELKIKIKLDDYCQHDWIVHVMPDDKILFCSKCNRCKE